MTADTMNKPSSSDERAEAAEQLSRDGLIMFQARTDAGEVRPEVAAEVVEEYFRRRDEHLLRRLLLALFIK